MTAQCSSEDLWVYLTTSRMLKQSAIAEKVEAQAKVEAKMRASDLCSTLTLTSAYLLDAALLGAAARQTAGVAATDRQGTGLKDGDYFTLEKSAAILASFPS
jgi:hypothetical protein